jgi:uncharacterized protein YceH (UPF0502 family)
MQLEEAPLEEALDALRQAGAVLLVQGDSRVDRFRHLAYDWLGVDKVELAVMAELLLRGAQTVGELRGRAARMEPIKDLSELTPTLDSLQSKGLILYLTPPGRGSVVSHALYLDRELEKVRREADADHVATGGSPVAGKTGEPPVTTRAARTVAEADTVMDQLDSLRDELAAVKRDFESARAEFAATADALRRQLDELNRQLGN